LEGLFGSPGGVLIIDHSTFAVANRF